MMIPENVFTSSILQKMTVERLQYAAIVHMSVYLPGNAVIPENAIDYINIVIVMEIDHTTRFP